MSQPARLSLHLLSTAKTDPSRSRDSSPPPWSRVRCVTCQNNDLHLGGRQADVCQLQGVIDSRSHPDSSPRLAHEELSEPFREQLRPRHLKLSDISVKGFRIPGDSPFHGEIFQNRQQPGIRKHHPMRGAEQRFESLLDLNRPVLGAFGLMDQGRKIAEVVDERLRDEQRMAALFQGMVSTSGMPEHRRGNWHVWNSEIMQGGASDLHRLHIRLLRCSRPVRAALTTG